MASAFREEVPTGPSAPPSVHGAKGAASAASGEKQPQHKPDTFLDGPGRDDDVSSDDHVQDKVPPAATLTKKQKFQRHCGRFKWWYVAGTIVFLAIILPVL